MTYAIGTCTPFPELVAAGRSVARFLVGIPIAHQRAVARASQMAWNPIKPLPWPTVRFALGVAQADVAKFCQLARTPRVRAATHRPRGEEDTQPIPSVD